MAANVTATTSEQIEDSLDDAMDKIDDNEQLSDKQKDLFQSVFGGIVEASSPENTKMAALLTIFCCALWILGAFFMLSLKKFGFYIYLASIAIVIAGMIMIFGNFMGIIYALWYIISRGIMSVLYGVNLKHMH
jgi:hypothetical protein